MPQYINVRAGDPFPGFTQRSYANPAYSTDTAAGRYLVFCFYHSAAQPLAQRALRAAASRPDLFNDDHASFFGISTDPADEAEKRVANRLPGYRHIWDFDRTASRRCGASPVEPVSDDSRRQIWLVTDPTLRVIAQIPFDPDGSDCVKLLDLIAGLPPPDLFAGVPLQAPILYLPHVFEPDFCAQLIALYDRQGGEISGFMRQVDGKTVGLHDRNHKSRRDVTMTDPALIRETQARIIRRIVPEIAKIHQFHVTRMERYLVACYDAAEGGHFSAHRDNTTAATKHRRFAVSVNLNDDFDGGEVSFPEYGPRGFKAPPGGAVVFSCSLLHKVSQVTRGRRYAFLPFLYDDAAAAVREANLHLLETTPPITEAKAES